MIEKTRLSRISLANYIFLEFKRNTELNKTTATGL